MKGHRKYTDIICKNIDDRQSHDCLPGGRRTRVCLIDDRCEKLSNATQDETRDKEDAAAAEMGDEGAINKNCHNPG